VIGVGAGESVGSLSGSRWRSRKLGEVGRHTSAEVLSGQWDIGLCMYIQLLISTL
jgi:hypothetical protein